MTETAAAQPIVSTNLPSESLVEAVSRRWLTRGESLVGFIGLGLAAILLATVAAAAWWSARRGQEAWVQIRGEQIRMLSSVLAQSAESMMAANDLSALRRLLVDARREHNLKSCRIVLPDGRVLADADPARITLVSLPPRWPAGPVDDPAPSDSDQVISLNRPLLIPGRGAARLCLQAVIPNDQTRAWELQAGLGAIGAIGLLALLMVYRHLRARLLPLGMLRESLLAVQQGLIPPNALRIRGYTGREAQAWNNVVERAVQAEAQDVEQRLKSALRSQRESRNDLEHACDALAVGMILLDAQSRVKHANGAAAVLLRSIREQMKGAEISQVVLETSVLEAVAAIIGGSGQRRVIEVRDEQQTGGGILRFTVRPLRREDQGGALITIEDLTQQRVADAARNSFVAQATHELRTPLTNMRLCLESALDDKDSDPEILREHFNRLNHETRRLERMIGEMLSLTEIEAGSLRLRKDDVRVDELVQQLRGGYEQQAAERRLTLSFELPPKLPVIHGDRDKIMLVLHNLLGNALKYTPAEGKVNVVVRADAGQIIVDVIDTGIGIRPEEQQKVFERFYRAKDARVGKITGSGLGLALAREVARLHGGEITVQSELNRGSTFTLVLPVTQPV